MEAPERIIDQIRKLRALATSSNEHEAALAAQKAQELLQKYNLTMADIPSEMLEPKDEQIQAEEMFIAKKAQGSSIRWKRELMTSLAYGNFCRLILTKQYKGEKFTLVGKGYNREVVFFLYNILSTKFETWSKAHSARSEYPGEWSPRKSFLHGACQAIRERMYEQRARFQADPTGKALAVLNVSDKALALAIEGLFGKVRKYNSGDHDTLNRDGFLSGYQAGKSVQIQKGVDSGSRKEVKSLRG